jgi:subtilisin family serine protease
MRPIRFALSALAVLALAACADQPSPMAGAPADAAPLLGAAPGRGIDGEYVVVLNEGADPRAVAAVAGASPRYVYTAAVNGFAASLNAGQLTALRHHPGVAYVEQDQAFRITATQSGAPWNLDRIDQRGPVGSGSTYTPTYTYRSTASSVYAYVIDTGINTTHTQFGERASIVYDALGGDGQDCNGHGTAVASIIGGSTYGVAKGVRLRGLRVTDCAGSATTSAIIAAVDWVRLNRTNPAVANLSLSGGLSSALNTAVNNLASSGVFISVAAGNNNADACGFSPASAVSAMTVMASTRTDARAPYSNYGSCTDIYAPGDSVPTATGIRSGTSMAAPHAAGVAALYKATYGNASTATITSWIKSNATPNAISGNPAGTPNLLLYSGGL